MLKYRISLTKTALQELRQISNYYIIKTGTHFISAKILRSIYQTIKNLQIFPEGNRLYEKSTTKPIRIATIKSYNIYYTVDKPSQTIKVLHILHSKQSQNTNLT